ncbi:MAG TPA: acyl carrier protein [Anaerolineae bacterium]|nr:acyl carrier protein [Anaerolineae bacterium]
MEQEIKATIHAFLDKHFPNNDLADSDDIFAQGFINSMFAMQLVLFVEEAFQLEISNAALDIANFRSVNHMVALIQGQRELIINN